MRGRVVEFDDARGFGAVEGDDGKRLFFHCTAIADGSRTIAVGAEVDYDVIAGHQGRWEAKRLSPPGPRP
ncbi:MAG: cold shock domain-containing protein [Actinobacteria bacterium]|nr:cold shock domain-containing protein [Actinomycetota bacterium]